MKDFVLFAVLIALVRIHASTAQFPTECMEDTANLEVKKCCPRDCGSEDGRGTCGSIDIDLPTPPNESTVRDAWPYYFNHICICNHNFAGYDCSRCKYGHYGVNCSSFKVVERRPISDYSPQEWEEYLKILELTKTYESNYSVFLSEPQLGHLSDPIKTTISLYNLFVWQHHYPAKDSDNEGLLKKDYAHESTGFPTWHRQFLLWFEWEVQYMLKDMEKKDYYMFRIPYWDWRKEKQTDNNSPLKANRLGQTVDNNGLPKVHGIMPSEFLNNWETTCWRKERNFDICNPDIATGQLQRCPLKESCDRRNELWPSDKDVQTILSLQEYDTPPYTKKAANSFRNYLEGFKPLSNDDIEFCRENKLCTCELGESKQDFNCTESDSGPQPTDPIQRLLHNSVHIILGLGYFGSDAQNDKSISGVMADVAASANDPIFLNHHAMVDCIFETWLQKNPNAQYPIGKLNEIPKGHRYDDYIVPFFPLYTHSDMFSTADKFGYRCMLQSGKSGLPSWAIIVISVTVTVVVLIVSLGLIICLIIVCIRMNVCCCKCNKLNYEGIPGVDGNDAQNPHLQNQSLENRA